MVLVMLAGVMFPLWPVKLRIGVWYLSILALGLLGALIVLAIVRLIFWCITVVVSKKAIWMFPNLFEDVGFVSQPFSSTAHSCSGSLTNMLCIFRDEQGGCSRSNFNHPSLSPLSPLPLLKLFWHNTYRNTRLIPVRLLCPSLGVR